MPAAEQSATSNEVAFRLALLAAMRNDFALQFSMRKEPPSMAQAATSMTSPPQTTQLQPLSDYREERTEENILSDTGYLTAMLIYLQKRRWPRWRNCCRRSCVRQLVPRSAPATPKGLSLPWNQKPTLWSYLLQGCSHNKFKKIFRQERRVQTFTPPSSCSKSICSPCAAGQNFNQHEACMLTWNLLFLGRAAKVARWRLAMGFGLTSSCPTSLSPGEGSPWPQENVLKVHTSTFKMMPMFHSQQWWIVNP